MIPLIPTAAKWLAGQLQVEKEKKSDFVITTGARLLTTRSLTRSLGGLIPPVFVFLSTPILASGGVEFVGWKRARCPNAVAPPTGIGSPISLYIMVLFDTNCRLHLS